MCKSAFQSSTKANVRLQQSKLEKQVSYKLTLFSKCVYYLTVCAGKEWEFHQKKLR